jgi:hypothetical protein
MFPEELPPELVSAIVDHVPLANLPQTLYSLLLSCRYMYNFIVPVHLYRYLRLDGDSRIMSIFKQFELDSRSSTMAGRLLPSRCVHHISIIFARDSTQIIPLLEKFKRLVAANLLPDLRSFSARLPTNDLFRLDLSMGRADLDSLGEDFWKSFISMCPKLRAIDISGFRLEPIDDLISGAQVSFSVHS